MCVIIQNFSKIGQEILKILQFFDFQDVCLPSAILDFQILIFLVAHQIGRPNMHRHAKFHQNRSNDCRDITFNVFQNGGRPPSFIFKIDFLNNSQGSEGQCAPACKISQKSVKPQLTYSNLSIFSRWRPSAILDLWGKFWNDPQ